MRYFLALVFPPLAILLTGRPISAALNLIFWPLGLLLAGVGIFITWPLATIHALFVVSQDAADERNRELMTAVTGKAIPRKTKAETRILIASASLLLLVAAVGTIAAQLGFIPAVANASQTENVEASTPTPLPALEGWTMDEVKSKHGPPIATDKTTGLATWKTFAATFTSGQVSAVHPAP